MLNIYATNIQISLKIDILKWHNTNDIQVTLLQVSTVTLLTGRFHLILLCTNKYLCIKNYKRTVCSVITQGHVVKKKIQISTHLPVYKRTASDPEFHAHV